jgi:molybdopterin-guanine dinucleotide biosynthesis protein A
VKSAIILVGGEARRANGQEKYFFSYQGKTFIERQIDALRGRVDEIVLVARDRAQCERFSRMNGVACTTDLRQGMGPVGGLHAGVLAVKGDLLFVSACDMPCVRPEVIEYLFSLIEGYDAVIPCWNPGMLEPLHAVYRREPLLRYFETHRGRSLRALVRNLRSRYVPVENLRPFDPNLRTFTNINRPEELDEINGSGIVKGRPS